MLDEQHIQARIPLWEALLQTIDTRPPVTVHSEWGAQIPRGRTSPQSAGLRSPVIIDSETPSVPLVHWPTDGDSH